MQIYNPHAMNVQPRRPQHEIRYADIERARADLLLDAAAMVESMADNPLYTEIGEAAFVQIDNANNLLANDHAKPDDKTLQQVHSIANNGSMIMDAYETLKNHRPLATRNTHTVDGYGISPAIEFLRAAENMYYNAHSAKTLADEGKERVPAAVNKYIAAHEQFERDLKALSQEQIGMSFPAPQSTYERLKTMSDNTSRGVA